MTIAGDTHTYSQRAREPRSSNLRLALVTGAAVTICVALATVLPMVLADRNNPITAQAVSTCRALAAAMFAGAGVLRIARGHICSDVRSTLLGLSLLTLGIVALPLAGLLRVLTASQPDSLVPSLSRGCTTVVVLTLVAHAMHSTRGPERLGAAGLAVRVALVASAVTLVSMLAAVWPATAMPTGHPIHLAVSLAVSGCWIEVAFWAHRRAERLPWTGRLAPLLMAMGVAEVMRGLAVSPADPWLLGAASVTASVSVIAVYCALIDLGSTFSGQHATLTVVTDALAHARSVASVAEARREELTHDARNALMGLRGALVTLRTYDGTLDDSVADRLRTAALDEVSHLEQMIRSSATTEPVELDVAPVVESVVLARRAAGLSVDLLAQPCRATACASDLARALQNLLVNAQEHGRGLSVSVRVVRIGDRVEVQVADRGPGVPEADAAKIFERGTRGLRSRGSGLGLHVSRTLMRRQGGDLQLRACEQGAVFALSLPAAATEAFSEGRAQPTARSGAVH